MSKELLGAVLTPKGEMTHQVWPYGKAFPELVHWKTEHSNRNQNQNFLYLCFTVLLELVFMEATYAGLWFVNVGRKSWDCVGKGFSLTSSGSDQRLGSPWAVWLSVRSETSGPPLRIKDDEWMRLACICLGSSTRTNSPCGISPLLCPEHSENSVPGWMLRCFLWPALAFDCDSPFSSWKTGCLSLLIRSVGLLQSERFSWDCASWVLFSAQVESSMFGQRSPPSSQLQKTGRKTQQ